MQRIEARSLVQRAREAISAAIADGSFSSGRLPAEEKLAEILGVSRGTVREALNLLEAEGQVSRRRGIGTVINAHLVAGRILLNHVEGFYELLEAASFTPSIAWSRLSTGRASIDMASRLGFDAAVKLVLLDRLLLANGQPAIHIVEMILPDAIVKPITESTLPNSLFEFADEFCARPIHHTVDEIIPSIATTEVARVLTTLQAGDPFLSLIETHYSDEARPFAISRINVVDKFVRFNVIRRRVQS